MCSTAAGIFQIESGGEVKDTSWIKLRSSDKDRNMVFKETFSNSLTL